MEMGEIIKLVNVVGAAVSKRVAVVHGKELLANKVEVPDGDIVK